MPGARFPFPVSASQLVGAYCPHCRARAGTVTRESSPQLIHHDRRWTEDGERRRCLADFVAVVHGASVEMIPVAARRQADAVLRAETDKWLAHQARQLHRYMLQRQAVADVYGVQI